MSKLQTTLSKSAITGILGCCLFISGLGMACDSLFSAPILSETVQGKLTLSVYSSGSVYSQGDLEQFDIMASPGQQVFVCGNSYVISGATPLASAEGITTYEMTSERAWFDFYGMLPSCAEKKTFQMHPVTSDQRFVLRWHKKQKNTPLDISSGNRKIGASYGGGLEEPGLDDLFKPGRPSFFLTGDGSTAVLHIFPSFLKSLSLFQQDTTETDYDYLTIAIQSPGEPPLHIRITRQQFRLFLNDYARSGQWLSLLDWLRANLSSRSSLINHLLDILVVFTDTDRLLLSNPRVSTAIINQLQGVLESPGHVFQLELELEWLNQSLAQIETPTTTGQDQKTTGQTSHGHPATEATASMAPAPPEQQVTDSGNSGNGPPPNPSSQHSYNQQPCPVCKHTFCKLRQPANTGANNKQETSGIKPPASGLTPVYMGECPASSVSKYPAGAMEVQESPEAGSYRNLIRLLNTYTREGVIIRVMLNPAISVTAMASEESASATYLFPGCCMSTFTNFGPGVILSSDIPLAAWFKENVMSIRLRGGQYFGSGQPDGTCVDYNTLTKPELWKLSFFKNHINMFSMKLKAMEKTLIFDRRSISDIIHIVTSGHIRADGMFQAGKIRMPKHRLTCLANNEVIVKWVNWQSKLLGFFIHDLDRKSVDWLSQLIAALLSVQPGLSELIMTLPVVIYDRYQASFTFINNAQAFVASHNVPEPKEPAVFDLLNQEGFPFNINQLAHMFYNYNCQWQSPVFCSPFDNSYLLRVLKTSLYRQYLEHKGIAFSEEEALVIAFSSTARTMNSTLLVQFRQLLINSGVSLTVVQDITMALVRLHNNGAAETHAPLAPADANRQEAYLHLLKFGLGQYTPMPEALLAQIHADNQSEVMVTQTLISNTIANTIFATIKRNKGHGWSLLLSELRLSIPCATVNRLRQTAGFSGQVHPWPYAEMMASIPGNLNLLDQLEALHSPTDSPFVNALFRHFVQSGLPRYPGTLRAGGEVTTEARNTLRTELAKRPTEQQINAIPSHFQVQSRQWETSEFPLWHNDPLEGMEQVEDWQPAMAGATGGTSFNGLPQAILNYQPKTSPAPMVERNWQCPICMNHAEQGSVVALECQHTIHDSCLKDLLQSDTAKNCPICRTPLTPFRTGNQPPGNMVWEVINKTCPGENTRETILIIYSIPGGAIHISGQLVRYQPDLRFAYLPNHKKGRKALAMLKTAFERGLVLAVGHSFSSGKDNVVVWNDIPHKTSLSYCPSGHCYPDPGYVDRLIAELRQRNIPEPD